MPRTLMDSDDGNSSKAKGWWQWARSTAMNFLKPDSNMTSSNSARPTHDIKLTEEQTRHVISVQAAAKAQVIARASCEELKKTLSDCAWISQVINLRDATGYNLLQTAIIMNRPDVVEYLIGQGADLNTPICGRPLHLAAQLGLTEVLEVLLKMGADPLVKSAVCYPGPHISDNFLYNPGTREWVTSCQNDLLLAQKSHLPAQSLHRSDNIQLGNSRKSEEKSIEGHHHTRGAFNYPYHFAIKGDNLDCVLLLQEHGTTQLKDGELSLHTAVSFNSLKCIDYFLTTEAATINQADVYGRVPVHYALSHGKEVVQMLVQKGALLNVKTPQQETLLHVLFAEVERIENMADLCEYLLECGLKVTINALDKNGNSPLHLCLMRVHHMMPTRENSWLELENCIQLLLNNKANPNITNRKGNMPLHVLLDIFQFDEESRQHLTENFNLKAKAIESLLSHLLASNANPRIPNKWSGSRSGHVPQDTPLMVFIYHLFLKGYSGWIYHAAKSLEPDERLAFLTRFREMSCTIMELLTKPSGAVRHEGGYHGKQRLPSCPVRLMLNHLDYIKVYGLEVLAEQLPVLEDYLQAMLAYLKVLLRVGFSPDACRDPAQIVDMFSILYEQKLVPFSMVYDFLMTLLQHGADANSCRYVIYDGVGAPDVDSYPLIRLLRPDSDTMYTPDERQILINVFMSCMDRSTLSQCLQRYVDLQNTDRLPIDNYVMERLTQPMTLKASTARVIRISLKGQFSLRVHKVPLPKEIQNYLLSLQY